jgi:chaperonin GroEL
MLIDINPRTVSFNDDARKNLIEGANILANAVKETLGPRGKTVVIDKNNASTGRLNGIIVTKDGVTVAKEINLTNPQQNTGAQLLKKAAIETLDHAGDGTTTATVLAQYILNKGYLSVTSGLNGVELKKGMDVAVSEIIGMLNDSRHFINSYDELYNISKISCNGDDEIAKLVTDVIWTLGKDGIVTIDESDNRHTTVNTVKGLKFSTGYVSKYFVNNSNKMTWEVENPAIVLSEEVITSAAAIQNLVAHFGQQNIPLLIIAKDFEENVVRYVADLKSRGYGEFCLVKAAGYGDLRRARLLDASIFTSADIFQSNKNYNLSDENAFTKAGTCDKVIISGETTLIIGSVVERDNAPENLKQAFDNYTESVKAEMNQEEDEYQKLKLKERYGNLVGGTAVIKVGGLNEAERREKKDRIDDAVHAAKCALDMGFVEGGGIAFLKIFNKMYKTQPSTLTIEQYQGYKLVRESLLQPLSVILENGGINALDVMPKFLGDGDLKGGYDARKMEFIDNMIDSGIIDPVKVSITALEKAVAISSIMLTTSCLINYANENKK